MRIAVDIDDVLANLTPVLNSYYNIKHGTKFVVEDYKEFDLSLIWGIPQDQIQKLVAEVFLSKEFKLMSPTPGSVKAITYLSKHHELHAVTARPPTIEHITLEWIQTHYPNMFKDIHHTNLFLHGNTPARKKSEVCKALDVDVIIEDNMEYASDCACEGITTLLFETLWNKDKKLEPNMIRVKNWDAVIPIIDSLHEQTTRT